MRNVFVFFIAIISALCVTSVAAVSFTADAVQIRGGQVSHAKLYWRDGLVRFDYVDDGVSMAQIFDMEKKKIIWLDSKNDLFVEKKMPDSDQIAATIKRNQIYDPCKQFKKASCLHLKKTRIKGREADEWLITVTKNNRDYHIFQWIDKKYKTIVRQENPDGSILTVDIADNQTMNGRKVRKLDMVAVSANGQETHGTQWYDNVLDVVVKQQYGKNYVDELKNIRVGNVKQAMFKIPHGYKQYVAPIQTAQQFKPLQ